MVLGVVARELLNYPQIYCLASLVPYWTSILLDYTIHNTLTNFITKSVSPRIRDLPVRLCLRAFLQVPK